MINMNMRNLSAKKKNVYTVKTINDGARLSRLDNTLSSRDSESVHMCLEMKELSMTHRQEPETHMSKERHGICNANGLYRNIPAVHMPGSCGLFTHGPTQAESAGTTSRKMAKPTCGPTQTNTACGAGNFGLVQTRWPLSPCPQIAVSLSHSEGDYHSIRDLAITSAVGHDDVMTLRHRLASTSSSSGVSSASEKSVASSVYANVMAILDRRKAKTTNAAEKTQGIKVTSPTQATSDKIRITTKAKSSSSSSRNSPRKALGVNKNVKYPKYGGKSGEGRGKSPPRRRRRVVSLARGLGCVGGARSRSVTPERHSLHRIHRLSTVQQEGLDAMLKNVQQRVRNIIEEGRYALNDVDDDRNDIRQDVGHYADVPLRTLPPRSKALTLSGSNVTGRRLSRWDQHQTPPDLSEITCRRSGTIGRHSKHSEIQKRPLPPIPSPPPQSSVTHMRTLDLSDVMRNSWISGIAVSRREEIIVVDLEQAYVLDLRGNLKRTIANKNVKNGMSGARLLEPIDVCVFNDGTMVFSDHADRQVKLFNPKGQHLRTIRNQCHMNIAGVSCNELGHIFVAGTDSGCVSVYGGQQCALRHIPDGAQLEHPYSVAVNPLTGSVIVGDDYKQVVMALSDKGKVLWRYCPSGERHFFPSSICVDNQGYIFIADLYNEKIYMLDSGGKLLKTLLSKGHGLHGGPGAIATDSKGHLYVADQEKSLKVFKYGQDGFTMYRRFSIVKKC